MNYINYVNHSIYKSNTYFRRFDLDVTWCQEKVKRVALSILPFIAMYTPAGTALSIVSNGLRFVSHMSQAIDAEDKKTWKQVSIEVGKMALTALALCVSLLHFTTALFITTSIDILQGIYNTGQALYQGEYWKGGEELLQTSSSVYLSFMICGALEAMLLFALLQTMTSLYQARGEIKDSHYIEAAGKIVMAILRLKSASHHVDAIQRRDEFLKKERTAALFAKIAQARAAKHLIQHPLSSLKERIEENDLRFLDSQGNEIHLGAHFHGNGKALVKGENIAFRTQMINGKEVIELDFKINHAFRDQLENSIDQLRNIGQKEMQEILSLTGSHASNISVQSGSFFKETLEHFMPGSAHQINVEGLGTILVGSEKNEPNLYDKVILRMDLNQNLYSLHEMLCLIDLSDALCLSTKDDIERLKMGHLFRSFFPKEALNFERSQAFFLLPLEQLKAKMIDKAPEMEEIFTTYYHRMKPEAIIGGRVRYRIEGLAEAAYKEGARALTAAVTGVYSDAELFKRVASMIRMGMLSTEVRHTNQMHQNGLSSGFEYQTGGADSVYTQLLTESACKEKRSLSELYHSKVRLLISLEALELGTYHYHYDMLGNRLIDEESWGWLNGSYAKRENILEFIRKEQRSFQRRNEVMLKERLSASFFKGLIVSDEKTKADLIHYLEKCNLIQNQLILNTSVDKFIRVGTHLSEELIA